MNQYQTTATPEHVVADLAHFAWCALIALHIVQQDGQALTPLASHAFLLRWLAGAQKQKRFPRTVAQDIESLLRLGRQKGPLAQLQKRLDYLWNACAEPLLHQSDLLRLTHAVEHIRTHGWINAVVEDAGWDCGQLQAEYRASSALLIKKSDLARSFSEDGTLLAPVHFLVIGDTAAIVEIFLAQKLDATVINQQAGWGMLALQPGAINKEGGDCTEATGEQSVGKNTGTKRD
ncbi:DUF2913 family protein [Tatumella sp. TA1]|nr:DUF2913 family protein [Tatumella sp. TA1]